MRLGVLIDRLGDAPGGAERHTLDLLQRARATGHSVVLATLPGSGAHGVEHVEVSAPRRRPTRDRVFAEGGVLALREAGCNVVLGFRHCPGVDVYLPHGGLVGDAITAQGAARGGVGVGRRLARALSGKVRFFLEAERALLGAAAGPRTICVSGALAARMHAVYPACADRTAVIPNGVDLEHFHPGRAHAAALELRERQGLADAYVGLLLAMHPRLKGAEIALRAMRHPTVEALSPPFHLLVAGGRLEPALRRLVRTLGLDARVHEIGLLPDARPAYAAADVLVHATYYDPCSLACLEALAMGLPIVTTPPNGVGELLGARGGIVLEEAGNAAALAVALSVLAESILRSSTAVDARRVAEAHPQSASLDRVLDVCNRA